MKPLYDLCEGVSDFNSDIILDVTALQKYSHRMQKEKDAGKIKDIYKILLYTPTLPTFPQIIKYKENTHDYAIPDVVS